jgi:ABC-type nickel/cobalt efflux system permease component RcnA
MKLPTLFPNLYSAIVIIMTTLGLMFGFADVAVAHPLGNFTINHFARLEIDLQQIAIHYVIDMAEIPAFQALQDADINQDGITSDTELSTLRQQLVPQYATGLRLKLDDADLLLQTGVSRISLPPGVGGLSTLRVEYDLSAAIPADQPTALHRLHFEDMNYPNRLGWREIVVHPVAGIQVFDSSAYGNSVTDELKAYPQDLLTTPLNERSADLSFTQAEVPAGATPLLTRQGRPLSRSQDPLAALIAIPEITPTIALVSLLIAAGLGAIHALSPGHGKTLVGAYLVGSRGTPSQAAFLGLTVTITHTIGVFALGLATLLASRYFLPEQLFPILSLISGSMVILLGLGLFIRRLQPFLSTSSHHSHEHHGHHAHDHHHHDHPPDHDHDHLHSRHSHPLHHHAHHHPHPHHEHDHSHHDHPHAHDHPSSPLSLSPSPHPPLSLTHSHGGHSHSHLPPGFDGSPASWRNLLALGISGGLLPCPSALVVFLSAVSLHRVGFGLLLVVAFSLGLAGTLTAIGLLFIYARRWLERLKGSNRWVSLVSVLSPLAIASVGIILCYETLIGSQTQIGFPAQVFTFLSQTIG